MDLNLLRQVKDGDSNIFYIASCLKSSLQTPFVKAGVASLTIFVAVFLFNWNIHNKNIQSATSLSDLVDTSGRQCMLSQRIVKNLLLLAENPANTHS